MFTLFWQLLVSNFVIIPRLFTLELIKSILTVSIWLSSSVYLSVSCSTLWTSLCLTLQHTGIKWFNLPHPLHLFPYAGHLWGGWMDPQYLHMHCWLFVAFACILPAFTIILPLGHSELLLAFFGLLLALPKEVPNYLSYFILIIC